MKKAFLACALFAGVLSANAQKQNVFKVNIFSPVAKTGSFFYERALNAKSSAQLGVGFTAYNKNDIKISGIFFTPEYRFYLSTNHEAPTGFYVGPYLRYQNLKIEEKASGSNGEAKLTTFGGGLVAGRHWIFSDIVSLDIFAGPNYNSGDVKVTSGNVTEVPTSFKGFGARVGVTLGLAF
jgi:hypothetical protein